MHVSRVTFRSELPSPSQENAAMAKQLDAAQKQLSKDMASGNMVAQIIDFVDISVDAVAAATVPNPAASVSTTVQVPDAVSSPDDSTQDPAPVPAPASTVVNQSDAVIATPVSDKPITYPAEAPGR